MVQEVIYLFHLTAVVMIKIKLLFTSKSTRVYVNHTLLTFLKKGFSQDIAPVSNILQCAELSILGVTFQQNCKYSSHVRAKVIKANKSLFVLGSLRKEGMSQEEVDHLFNAIVLPNFLTLCRFMVPQIPTFL